MSHHPFGARQLVTTLTGLDFGLSVRVDARPAQRPMFSGPENAGVQALTAELAEGVSGLRVYSYAVRRQLEEVTSLLQVNVACGSWGFARRAALDLASILSVAKNRHQVDASRAACASERALQIAALCPSAVR